jgi:hypothetical protein
VDDERWREVYVALNGAGVESMQVKWDEMFGVQAQPEPRPTEEAVEELKVKRPRKKASTKKTSGKKPATDKAVKESEKATNRKKPAVKKSVKNKSSGE